MTVGEEEGDVVGISNKQVAFLPNRATALLKANVVSIKPQGSPALAQTACPVLTTVVTHPGHPAKKELVTGQ